MFGPVREYLAGISTQPFVNRLISECLTHPYAARSPLQWLHGESFHGKKCRVSLRSTAPDHSLIGFPVYIFAQLVGATIGAALAYAQYIHAIDLFEGGRSVRTQATASLFVSYPVSKFDLIFS